MRRATQVIFALLVALPALPIAATAQSKPAAKLKVAVSIAPQAYFVERVAGSRAEVAILVGAGQSPHTYEPSPKQVAALADVRVYFRTGVDFENAFVPRLQRMFKGLAIVDTRAGVPLRTFTAEESSAERHAEHGKHGAEQEHEHAEAAGQPDPHVWLNPQFVKIQARTICDALVQLDPPGAEEYRQNLAAFEADLDRVHAEIAALLAPLKGRAVLVFHPAFGYFTDAYGLKQVPVEIEGKEPTARQLTQLIERAKAERVKVIFVQPQFSPKSAAAVADAIGAVVVPIDDLARDYLGNLEQMAEKIRTGLRRE